MAPFAACVRRGLRRIVLGNADLPQQCTVGIRDPQSEVSVWLHGLGEPRNVTRTHTVACAAPFTVGIGFESGLPRELRRSIRLNLEFRRRGGDERLLGEAGLQFSDVASPKEPWLGLFTVRRCRNYCLPAPRLWAQSLHQSYLRWRNSADSDMPVSAHDVNSMAVFFICPRPVVLVSAGDSQVGNMFPMNLMGAIGQGYYGFALNSTRQAAQVVERAGRVALSSIPFEQAGLARQLGKNHRRESLDWNQLPFATRASESFGIPVPCFALRVRELEIENVRKLGSHTLFVARLIREELTVDAPQFFMLHGTYQAWRMKAREAAASA
jgi:flavin reductase (DIM6/NTAB) family NADH-FMN oxidoreductase RutF